MFFLCKNHENVIRELQRRTLLSNCRKLEILMFLILDNFSQTIFCPELPQPAQPTTSNFGQIFPNNFKTQVLFTEAPVY